MGRRLKSAFFGALAALIAAAASQADEFPTRPIRLVVPYAAGGPTDVVGRVVADYLAKDLKQATFVENKGGAQGAIGAEAVARGEADEYTLLVVSGSMLRSIRCCTRSWPTIPTGIFARLRSSPKIRW